MQMATGPSVRSAPQSASWPLSIHPPLEPGCWRRADAPTQRRTAVYRPASSPAGPVLLGAVSPASSTVPAPVAHWQTLRSPPSAPPTRSSLSLLHRATPALHLRQAPRGFRQEKVVAARLSGHNWETVVLSLRATSCVQCAIAQPQHAIVRAPASPVDWWRAIEHRPGPALGRQSDTTYPVHAGQGRRVPCPLSQRGLPIR